jgi:O-antigen ligase
MWQAALNMWADHPLTGVGLKNFSSSRSYTPLSFSGGSDIEDPSGGYRRVELLTPHNLYLLILAEQGLVGIFTYGVLFLSLAMAGFKRLSKTKEPSVQRAFGLDAMGFLASQIVAWLYGDMGGPGMPLVGILLGALLWWASGKESQEKINETNETRFYATP